MYIYTPLIASVLLFITACTYMPSPDESADNNQTVLPAIMFCLFAQCSGEWADRSERAGGDSSSQDETNQSSGQKLDNKIKIMP